MPRPTSRRSKRISPFVAVFAWFTSWLHPSWLLYTALCGFISGLALCLALATFWSTSPLWLVAALLFIIFSLMLPRRWLVLPVFLAGALLGNFRIAPELTSRAYFSQLVGQEVTITGQITEDPDASSGQIVLRLKSLHLGQSPDLLSGTLYVQLSGCSSELLRSDTVTLRGELNAGFGTFVASLYRPELLAVDRAIPGDLFAVIKQNFAASVHNYIASPAADLGLGYLMGLKNGLSKDFSQALQTVGMTHVVVASGAHLGIIVGLTKKLFGRLSRFAELLSALLMIAAFTLVVGFTASMTRAALVTSLTLLFGYVGRRFTSLRLLILVAALTLSFSPLFLLNLGWQLSFASFFGLLVVLPRLTRQFYGGKTPPWLANMLLTSLATSLVCAPILIYNYGLISLLSFVANLIILPTLPYIMLGVFLTGVTSFLPFLATLFARLATLLLDLHFAVINYLSQQTMFIFQLPQGDLRIFLIYLPLALYLVFPSGWRHLRLLRPKRAPAEPHRLSTG